MIAVLALTGLSVRSMAVFFEIEKKMQQNVENSSKQTFQMTSQEIHRVRLKIVNPYDTTIVIGDILDDSVKQYYLTVCIIHDCFGFISVLLNFLLVFPMRLTKH